MATTINFPSSPSIDDTYLYETITYTWNGTSWYVNKLFNLPTDSVGIPNLKNILKNTSIPITTVSTNVIGDVIYNTPGTYSWTCPNDVTSVCVVAVGGGGGGSQYSANNQGGAGGGLGYKNNITVVPGNSYTVVVGAGGVKGVYGTEAAGSGGDSYFINTSTVKGGGGVGGQYAVAQTTGGTYTGDGGGNGGYAPTLNGYAAGGGGAGGYSGAGGNPSLEYYGNGSPGVGGAGGAGGNCGANDTASGGGGVGIFGEGTNGVGGIGASVDAATGGGGGSGGTDGGIWNTANIKARGGLYGGGGGASDTSINENGDGGDGAVRILWGTGRSFPSTNVDSSGVYASKVLEIDWSLGIQCEPIVLTMDTELTFTGYISGQTLTLEILGDYVLTLPVGVDAAISSSYDGTVTNYIQLYCVDSTTPKFLAGIIL